MSRTDHEGNEPENRGNGESAVVTLIAENLSFLRFAVSPILRFILRSGQAKSLRGFEASARCLRAWRILYLISAMNCSLGLMMASWST